MQLGRNLPGFDFLADLDGVRNRVDSGGVAENRALEPLVNHPAKLDVVISKERTARGRQDEKDHQGRAQERIVGEPSGFAGLSTCRDLEFYGHNSDEWIPATGLDDGAYPRRYPRPKDLFAGQTERSASSIDFGRDNLF